VREREFRALCSYVREVMDIIGLPQWKLIMMRDRPDDAGPDAEGYCSPLFGQHTVNMWFDPNLPRQIPVRSRYVVVHEIMHIPLHACWQSWSQPLMNDGLIARTTYDAIVANGITTWEMCIDTLARGFAPTLPFIDWGAKPDPKWIPKAKTADELHIVSRMWDKADHLTPG
jgi:hypothetical protein